VFEDLRLLLVLGPILEVVVNNPHHLDEANARIVMKVLNHVGYIGRDALVGLPFLLLKGIERFWHHKNQEDAHQVELKKKRIGEGAMVLGF
jgi:hypothetical protein